MPVHGPRDLLGTPNSAHAHKVPLMEVPEVPPKPNRKKGRKAKPDLHLDTGTKRFGGVVIQPPKAAAFRNPEPVRDVIKVTALASPQPRSAVPLPTVPVDPHTPLPSLVTIEDVRDGLVACALAAHAASDSITEAGKLGRGIQTIANSFMERKEELVTHLGVPASPTSAHPNIPSPSSPSGKSFARIPALSPLSHSLTELHKVIWALTYQLHYYKTHTFPLSGTKRRRLSQLYLELNETWRGLLIELAFSIARNSSNAASAATGNVAKLAVATGAPDWEELTLDDASKLFMQGDKYLLGFGVVRSYDIAYKRYQAAAKFGLPEAMNMLGLMYEHGLGRPKDMAAAIRWYGQAANKSHPESLANMGRIHELGKGVPTDPRTALELYLLASQAGHLDAMCSLGHLLETGSGCKRNPQEAIRWYRVAADQECARAQNALGSAYYRGVGINKDFGEAVAWYRRAAECGDSNAHNNLGICYEEGLGVGKDLAMAKIMYKLAAEARHPSGVNNLGYTCLVEKNFTEAIRLFHLACSLGSVDAAHNLGTLYENGCKDIAGAVLNADWEMAARFYQEAADKNFSKSQLRLGHLLLIAPAPLQNHRKAMHYLTLAASHPNEENAEAQNILGEMVETGLGGGEHADHAQAAKWYRKAVKHGHSRAMFNLGSLYEAGLGVGKDLDRAIKFYSEAEQKGSIHARDRLCALRELGLMSKNPS